MKTAALALAAGALLAAHGTPVSAAPTSFTNADAANNWISNAGNWSPGLPTGGNTGTIDINAGYDSTATHTGYNVTHTGGTISRNNGFSGLNLSTGTTWLMNGANAKISSTRGISLGAGSTFTLSNGDANLSDNNTDTTVSGAGASLTVSGGTMTIGRNLIVRDAATLTINGGSISGIDDLFSPSFGSSAAGFHFNGGTTSANKFNLAKPSTATFGGSTAGSLTLLTELGTGVTLNWLPNSLMSLAVAGADQTFYQGLYSANTLRFNNSNSGSFGDIFQVSGSTLTLVPEPASLALVGLGGLLILGRGGRGRRND